MMTTMTTGTIQGTTHVDSSGNLEPKERAQSEVPQHQGTLRNKTTKIPILRKGKFQSNDFQEDLPLLHLVRPRRGWVPSRRPKKEFKANPADYVVMVYQTDMLHWPHEHQRYNYVHHHGTKAYVPTGDNKGGHMMILTQYYERLPAMGNNILPSEYRDEYTDHMIRQSRMLHSKTNKPIMPGRGMGLGDAPDLKIIGDIDPSDIHQGSVGDCWLLSGILAMAEFDGAIKQLFCKTM